jgi:hypothetical protein
MAESLADFLAHYTAAEEAYPAIRFLPLVCSCGRDRFRLARAWSSIQRTCAGCGAVRYIDRFGTSDGWDEAVGEGEIPEPFECPECASAEAHVCLGFAGYANHPGCKDKVAPVPEAVLWYYVGVRCCRCWLDGLFGDGKVGRGPMDEAVFREIAGEPPE